MDVPTPPTTSPFHESIAIRAIDICSKNLNKIGKGAYPSGVLTITRCPVWQRLFAGGNDAIQRSCRYAGAARGKGGYEAMHSRFASVQYITVTFNISPSDMTWIYVNQLDNDLANPPRDPSPISQTLTLR